MIVNEHHTLQLVPLRFAIGLVVGCTACEVSEPISETECPPLDREACAANEACEPVTDRNGAFYECVASYRCDDEPTCAKHDERIAEFRSTCLPSGWSQVRETVCEQYNSRCNRLSNVECEEESGCVPLVDNNGLYHECVATDACADAPICGRNGPMSGIFAMGCLPSDWEVLSSSECAEVVVQCSELDENECRTEETCRDLHDTSGTFWGCGVDGNCGDDSSCATDGTTKVMFTTTCIPLGWQQLRYEECAECSGSVCSN